jgi:hypothetical protein
LIALQDRSVGGLAIACLVLPTTLKFRMSYFRDTNDDEAGEARAAVAVHGPSG